ncbi:MAG: protein-L-isoaspartate(D-aspartate) O-methyltransferase [Candidatus Methanosuratincola petrocarbonis]|nr:protein-L-isoaspartate(D-aspartate) O-methyltransferase [Candidatus Methanosuratincola sp.]
MSDKREQLVRRLIEEGVLSQPEVIKAMSKVPREEFVVPELREQAYMDTPLPSLEGQTISAPHMVAIMCQLLSLKPGHIVLEVGAGTGYHAAVCAEIVAPRQPGARDGHVFAIERVRSLVEFARSNLARCGYSDRVTVVEGDGTLGYPDAAPYDAILVTAAAPRIPPPLKSQLRDGGRMVIPVGEAYSIQDLIVVERTGSDFKEWTYGGCVFVPLCGRYGWSQ